MDSLQAFINQKLLVHSVAGDVSGATAGVKYFSPEGVSGFVAGTVSGTDHLTATIGTGVLNAEGTWKVKSRILLGGFEYLGPSVELTILGRDE